MAGAPALCLLQNVCEQLNRSLAQADSSYTEFVDACNTAIKSCDEAAKFCGCKANEAQGRKHFGDRTAVLIGVAAAAAAVFFIFTGGLGALAVGAAGSGITLWTSSGYAECEASFRSIKQDFGYLLRFTYDLQQDITHVNTTLEAISTQVEHTTHWAKTCNGKSVLLVHDALKCLNVKYSESQGTTAECRERMNSKLSELKKK